MPSKQITEEIRARVSIVEVVGKVVTLKKSGRNFKGLCPFHQEKSPSFMVNDEKQIFHCFGCGEGGDIFTFLMKFEHLTFPEALQSLAKKAGVKLPARSSINRSQEEELERRKELGFKLNRAACDHFVTNLHHPTIGKRALEYLRQRGLSPENITQHFLGYADNRWDALLSKLNAQRAPLPLAEALGLVRKSQSTGNYYDFFRERIMFPIQDSQGNVIGFGGRILAGNDAKYINSSDSFLYHKSKSVYGLNFAIEAIRKEDEVILVEGYMDVLPLRQAGIRNVAAPLGTACTEEHLRLLLRYTKNFVLAFDGDSAGRQAALRTLPLFLGLGITPKVISLPIGSDPGSFIIQSGREAWEELKKNGKTLFEFLIEAVVKTKPATTTDRLRCWNQISPYLSQVQNPLEASIYRKRVAEVLGVEETWLKTKPNTVQDLPPRGKTAKETQTFPETERLLLAAMILHPHVIDQVQGKGSDLFRHPILKKTAETLFTKHHQGTAISMAALQGDLDETFAQWLREIILLEEDPKIWEKIAADCLAKIQGGVVTTQLQQLNIAIAKAENEGNEIELKKSLTQKAALAARNKMR